MLPPNQMPPQNRGPAPMPPQGGAPAMPLQGGAPMMQPPAQAMHPDMQGIPPDVAAQHIDPNNPIQMDLIKRVKTINPQEAQALHSGISRPAAMVLKRLLPEIGFLIDKVAGAGAPGGQPPMPGGQPPMPGGQPRPMTRLGNV